VQLASFDDDQVGMVIGDEIVDIGGHPLLVGGAATSKMRTLIGRWDQIGPDIANMRKPRLRLADVVLNSPITDPPKIVAAPVNYVAHQVEMNEDFQVDSLGVFLKAPSSAIGHGGTVRLPYTDRRFDHEAELAAVIGRTARHVSAQQALGYVFGYTGLLDMTMRGGEDRSTRKSFDTFTPMGPWIVTADEFGPPDNVDLVLAVNNQVRQRANTRSLIWSVARLIAYVSSVMTLMPGDVVTTGTPAGVGPVYEGDRVDLDVSGLGRLSVNISSSDAVLCPTLGAGRGPVPPEPRK